MAWVLAAAPAPADITVGGDRPFTVFVPSNHDPAVPLPLILFLHGYYGGNPDYDGAWVEREFGFRDFQDSEQFLYAHPDGVPDACGVRAWNATDACCRGFCGGDPIDDSAWFRASIAEIQTKIEVDAARIYIAGYSGGGFMAHRLACDLADLLAAVASFAGATWQDPGRCQPATALHFLEVHGTRDESVPYGGSAFNVGGVPVPFPGAEEAVRRWALHNGCATDPTTEPFDLLPGMAGAETEVLRFGEACAAGGSAELWKIVEGEHFSIAYTPDFTLNVIRWLLAHPKFPAPSASFTLAPESGPVPLDVRFDGSGSAAPEGASLTDYRWDFGDGTAGQGEQANHTYTQPGRYFASLKVATADGRWSFTFRHLITPLWPAGDTSPWTQATIGEPAFPGTARRNEGSGDLLLSAGGRGALAAVTSDEWLFLHQEANGDFRLTARVSDLEGGGLNARVGLAFRESLAPNARFAGVFLIRSAAGDRLLFGHRVSLSAIFRSGAAVEGGATWLRIERRGDLFTGLASADGEEWTLVKEEEIAGLPPALLLGITATGSDVTPAGGFTAFRSRVSGLDLVPLGPTFRRGDANGDVRVDIADGLRILNHLFLGALAPACTDAADANDSGGDHLDLSDAVAIFEFLFLGTRPGLPPPGHAACGADPTEDALGCGRSEGCAG